MKKLFTVALLVFLLSGCVYSKVKAPLDTDVENTSLGSKVGQASNYSVLWLVAWGDAGTQAAASNGGISVVKHLDIEQQIILFGAFSRMTTIAYGD